MLRPTPGEQYTPARPSPAAYLYVVARNHARGAYSSRYVPVSDDHLAAIPAPEPGPEDRLDLLYLEQAIRHLAPHQSQVVGLQLDGYTDTAIAAALNITTDAVRSHRRHAKNAPRHPTTTNA
ncbi:RNA polymerase sigma factor [Streptomyces sp. NPDC051563]|uniref:RNA polymerase sigma factor n=1 Tax=Streptomyces sp. NPDC051563 TaxID=3365659 RepID=UPI0037BC00FF